MCHSLSTLASSSQIVASPRSLMTFDDRFRNKPHYKAHYNCGANVEVVTILQLISKTASRFSGQRMHLKYNIIYITYENPQWTIKNFLW